MSELDEHIYATARNALEQIPEADRAGIYVVSFLVYDEEDDPRLSTITVGYNTEARVAECTPHRGQKPRWPIASDADEARWNYAFFVQNELAVICDTDQDPDGAALREAWAKERGDWYTDDDEEADFEEAMSHGEALTAAFVSLVVDVVQRLHGRGDVDRVFGRGVPVLIHELEYYDEIAEQNLAANPSCLADEFARWIRSM